MHLVRPEAVFLSALIVVVAACTANPAPATGVPSPTSTGPPSRGPAAGAAARERAGAARAGDSTSAGSRLPPIPFVDGPLQLRVTYPPPSHAFAATRDSNFILGSTGSGLAMLAINGANVPVYPNGAFLAWLPVPSGDNPHYELSAKRGPDSAAITVPITVRAPVMLLPDTGKLLVDRASVTPAGRLMLRSAERVRVAIRAPQDAQVVLRTGEGAVHALARNTGVAWSTDVAAGELAHGGSVVVHRGADSIEVKTAAVALVDAAAPRYAELLNADDAATSDTDQVTILRPAPEGTYKWFLFPGTTLEITGQRAGYLRVRLDEQLEAWVEQRHTRAMPETAPAPRRTAGDARVMVGKGFSDLRISVTARPAYLVEEVSPAQLRLTLYGVSSNVDNVNFATNDPSIRDVTWKQDTSDRTIFTVELRHEPFGYLALWDRGSFVLRVRRPPVVSAERPLAGRVIAIDPGHPPSGSTGPTGLYEGDAVLEVAEQVKPMLEARGATVVMTRTTRAAVPLGERAIIARRAGAEVLVSIHLNALPDGANPFRINGTGTYFFHHHAEPLARAVQRGLVREMGLRDLGINYDNLALVRPTWQPAVLCEGAFVIVPEQEAAMRTVEYQKRYALGIVEGLEEYFLALRK
ncbi:MAG TPA: N-acetylmuramoyl-L-alanine amidase [Gemmatimonadaceae bacterium]|nr:N-acetylmuramoyl-L-alanine amidase [Gemmatimonadaceae bacterium]